MLLAVFEGYGYDILFLLLKTRLLSLMRSGKIFYILVLFMIQETVSCSASFTAVKNDKIFWWKGVGALKILRKIFFQTINTKNPLTWMFIVNVLACSCFYEAIVMFLNAPAQQKIFSFC